MALFALMATDAGRRLIQPIDDAFLRWIVSLRTGWLTVVARLFNLVGLTYVMTPIRLGIAGWLAIRRRWWHFAAFVSAIVVSEISIGTLKALYDRPRALGSLVETSGASFPSGHAVAASVTAVAAVIALVPEGPRRYRWGAVAVAFSSADGPVEDVPGSALALGRGRGCAVGNHRSRSGPLWSTHRVRERRTSGDVTPLE